ncbi:MAG: ribulose 1,5-bisphosphate carboxylase [Candidatus Firestonebacteria bacterium]|nr:ribulose 1,5-bisphosphate carboxylase [Candidatus Firestonebacteria bacterium]
MPHLIEISYEITPEQGTDIKRLSREIALEQTVEVPDDVVVDPVIRDNVVGRTLDITPLGGVPARYRVVIGYSPEVTGYQLPQFLNVLFGNISLKTNIRIVDFQLPEIFFRHFPGPKVGVDGLRQWLGVYNRPLAATALKPMGSSPQTLAEQAGAFALGGGDIIKDDHGLADQSFCPFEERVSRCQEAVTQANAVTGSVTLYFPNVVGEPEQVVRQVEFALSAGVRGILVSPLLVGPGLVSFLSRKYPLAIMAHPAFTGTHFHDRRHGMTPAVLLGKVFRLLGADISVFPNSGGRFGFTPEECSDLAAALRSPWENRRVAWPAPAGGMQLSRIGDMAVQYGPDTVLLVGGALQQAAAGITEGIRTFLQAIEQQFPEQRPDTGRFTPSDALPRSRT